MGKLEKTKQKLEMLDFESLQNSNWSKYGHFIIYLYCIPREGCGSYDFATNGKLALHNMSMVSTKLSVNDILLININSVCKNSFIEMDMFAKCLR